MAITTPTAAMGGLCGSWEVTRDCSNCLLAVAEVDLGLLAWAPAEKPESAVDSCQFCAVVVNAVGKGRALDVRFNTVCAWLLDRKASPAWLVFVCVCV